jgi:RimJ/RimL family protein N-acetyltransferase
MMIIRTIRKSDAEQFLSLCKQLDTETQNMLLEPGERKTTLEEQQTQIDMILNQENQTIFVAEQGNQLVGYLAASGGTFKRSRHNVYLVIGILQAFTGQGIGTQLFQRLEQWAHHHHIHRLELTVMTHNTSGIALYKKQGFEIEGTRKQALQIDGQYVDEFYMSKLLDRPASNT